MKCLLAVFLLAAANLGAAERPRLCVLTDIGGDPDDQQSMVRLMVYANEFEIEGLIATAAGTPGELKETRTRPELIREIVAAYGKVRENLARHAGPRAKLFRERRQPCLRQYASIHGHL